MKTAEAERLPRLLLLGTPVVSADCGRGTSNPRDPMPDSKLADLEPFEAWAPKQPDDLRDDQQWRTVATLVNAERTATPQDGPPR